MEFTYADNHISFLHKGESFSCSCLFCDESLKESDDGMEFLTSPYYQAAEDYFTVYMGNGNDKYSIGVLIPLQLLEEDEDVIKDMEPFYVRHSSLVVRMAIEYLINNVDLSKLPKEFHLSDGFKSPNISIFLFNKENAGDDISCIIPSLYDNGFYLLKDPLQESGLKYYTSDYMKDVASEKRLRRSRKITVKPLNHFGKQSYFYNFLYTELLPFVEDPFYRFISLYQAIELLSMYIYDEELERQVLRYKQKQISKNELRENLIDAVKESKQIQLMYQGVRWKDDDDLLSKIDGLFDRVSIEKPKSGELSSYIYLLRNKIVHEMRSLYPHRNDIKDIVDYLDKNIFYLLAENSVKQ